MTEQTIVEDLTGTWEQIPANIEVLGTWTGVVPDPVTEKLADRGFIFLTQVREVDPILAEAFEAIGDEEPDPDAEPKKDKARMAILGKRLWEHSVISEGDILGIDERGHLTSLSEEFLKANFRRPA
jgi:hypothetical protein